MQGNTKKRLGATLSALVILIPTGLIMAAGIYLLQFTRGEGILVNGFLAVYLLCGLAVAVGLVMVLRQRWKEIHRGEEEEARKY